MLFHDRTYAAFLLVNQLKQYKNCNGVVLAIPNGGVPIGYQVAHLLNIPLDLIFSKKIERSTNPKFAIEAVSADEVIVDKGNCVGVSADYITRQSRILKKEMINRRSQLVGGVQPIPLKDKTVILTDDGIATGNTALACIRNVREQKPKKIIVAVPVASTSAYNALSTEVDEFISLLIPRHLNAVGEFYENFSQVSDDEVKRMINKARAEQKEIIPSRV